MTALRLKDKLFLAVVMPIALIAAYHSLWRKDAVARIDELERTRQTLVEEDAFDAALARAKAELKSAQDELAAEQSMPPPATRVKAKADETLAMREKAVLDILRSAKLVVTKGETSAPAPDGEILKSTGTRPEPQLRTYVVSGRYPDVVRALALFAEREMAVVPEAVEMRAAGRDRWTISLWL